MAEKSLIDQIKHYQKDIERCPDNLDRMLRCIKRLYILPIKVEHLQETGIGRSVNGLRKYSGPVSDAATALVAKWKAMVASEESESEEVPVEMNIDEKEGTEMLDEVEESPEQLCNGDLRGNKTQNSLRLSKDKENIRHNHSEKPKEESRKKESGKHSSKTDKGHKRDNTDKERSSQSNTKEKTSESTKEKKSEKLKSEKSHQSKHSSSHSNRNKHPEKYSSSSKDCKKDKISSKDKTPVKEKSVSKDRKHESEKKVKDSRESKHHSNKKSKDHSSKSYQKSKKSNSDNEEEFQRSHKRKHFSEEEFENSSSDNESPAHTSKKRKHSSSKKIKKTQSCSDEEEEKPSVQITRSDSDSEEETHKFHKRKHSSELKECKYKKVKIKEEPKSESSAPEDEEEVYSDEESQHISESSHKEGYESSVPEESDDPDASPLNNVNIKVEKFSESESEEEPPPKVKDHKRNDKSSSSSSQSRLKEKSKHSEHQSSSHKKKVSRDDEFTNEELEELIRENELKMKKEEAEAERKSRSAPGKVKKVKVKIETNQDGSIDSGCGASFGDALLGLDSVKTSKTKKKSKTSSSVSTSSPSKASDSRASSMRSSPTPSACSSIGSSPCKPRNSKSIQDLIKEPPELLSKRVKLDTLNSLDISSTLPEINPNYRPLPQVPMKAHKGAIMDDNAMFAIMTTKNQRTKVFSGNKGYYHQVPSLYSFCIQILYDNIDGLEYTGGVPFDILKPLLDKLSADQLLSLEHFNPYLIEDTDNLWKFHANKDFKSKQRDEDETWREFYLRCIDERESKLKRLTSNIIESMQKSTPVRQAKLAYVDTVAKPPRNIARKQAKFGTGNPSSAGESAKLAAAGQNAQKKKEIVTKAVVGGFNPSTPVTDVVPAAPAAANPSSQFNNPQTAAKMLKKKKAPLMAKALQLIKSNCSWETKKD